MKTTNAGLSNVVIPAGPQPLADEDLGSVTGGKGHGKKRRTTGYRRTSRWSRHSHHGRKSKYSKF
jgi:hypothetical protein